MNVVITTATETEGTRLKEVLTNDHGVRPSMQVSFHMSGVGLLSSCFSISRLIFEKKPDLIIQAGIAGTFDTTLPLGKVVAVRDEIMADLGVEENGCFLDLFDLKLAPENGFPFERRKLRNPHLSQINCTALAEVIGITVNEITTREARVRELLAKYNPVTESMEGASLHYCCLQTRTPFIQIRAISNYIGERDKSKWNFRESLQNLAVNVAALIEQLNTKGEGSQNINR